MIHIKLSDPRPARAEDPMKRDWIGYDPAASNQDLWEHNRGTWRLNLPRARREDYVLFSHKGAVKFVAEIHGAESIGDRNRIILNGQPLGPDHPMSRRWVVGAPAPDGNRNPVHYFYDSASAASICRCGCAEPVPPGRAFLPGHDQKAVHERIAKRWGGTVGFIEWFDSTDPQ
jgi:hypothetical protein